LCIERLKMPAISDSKRSTLALCIPAYNAAAYLPRILGSARKQNIQFDEILVYDDVSSDNTQQVAESFGARVIRGKKNLGCTWGRKILAEQVQSEWIHFHDADDDMGRNFTALAHIWMVKSEAPDVVLFNYDWIDSATGNVLGKTRFDKLKAEGDPILFTLETQVNPFCGLYRTKSFLEAGGPDTDPEVKNYEDAAMHCKLAQAGLKFSVEEEVAITNYCIPNSMSRTVATYINNIRSIYHTYKKAFDSLQTYEKFMLYQRAIGLRMWQNTRHAAWVSQWDMINKSIQLAKECGVNEPVLDSKHFRMLCRIHPFYAVVLREMISRLTRKKGQYWY
jgi:glycosyltransferase involved in cell wall biosynthesis